VLPPEAAVSGEADHDLADLIQGGTKEGGKEQRKCLGRIGKGGGKRAAL